MNVDELFVKKPDANRKANLRCLVPLTNWQSEQRRILSDETLRFARIDDQSDPTASHYRLVESGLTPAHYYLQ